MSELPRWASRGFGTGMALSFQVPVAVAIVAAFPDLKFGYPLVLLPLLAVGPVAVRGLGQDEQDSAIVRGVIALAQSLNLSVTAEGIETFEQLAQLRDLGCNHGQGYLLSRPLASDALGNLLARSTVQLPSPKHGILLDHRRAAS